MLEKHLQRIYNAHLRASRVHRDKPFSPRKDFKDFDAGKTVHLKRIHNLLSRYDHISMDQYFAAPYKLYPETEYFDLQFFAGMGAVKSFTLYMKALQELPPDSDYQMEQIKNSLRFIAKFCVDNKIELSAYPEHKTGITYDWMKHIKTRKISLYVMMGFDGVYDKIAGIPEDERELLLGDIGKYFLGYKTKYLQSVRAKHLIDEGLKRIEKLVSTSR